MMFFIINSVYSKITKIFIICKFFNFKNNLVLKIINSFIYLINFDKFVKFNYYKTLNGY